MSQKQLVWYIVCVRSLCGKRKVIKKKRTEEERKLLFLLRVYKKAKCLPVGAEYFNKKNKEFLQ